MEKKNAEKYRMRRGVILLFWLCVWQLAALLVGNEILLVSPAAALSRLAELAGEREFWQTIFHSMGRIGMGFGLGTVTGLVLAALSSRSSLLEEVLSPVITLCKTVPVASFVVLLLIWWGSERLAVSICFLLVLPNIYISTLEGIRSTDSKLLELAEVFRMPMKNRFFYIYRPALKSFCHSSFKLSLGMCWKSGVAAEVIGTPELSIGERLYFSKIHLDTAGVFAWTAVIILLSIGMEKLVFWLTAKFFDWEPACRSAEAGSSGKQELQICRLSKKYGELQLFSDFTVNYQRGKTYYISSPSGSGKTTLFRILCGLEQADSGIVERGIRYSVMFQEDRLCEDYSARRNVEMILGDADKAEQALLKVLDREAICKPCRELSGGMKRRVALVRAMEAAGDCVLLDEPFTGLDACAREAAERYIIERQQGRILLIATHI